MAPHIINIMTKIAGLRVPMNLVLRVVPIIFPCFVEADIVTMEGKSTTTLRAKGLVELGKGVS